MASCSSTYYDVKKTKNALVDTSTTIILGVRYQVWDIEEEGFVEHENKIFRLT